MQSEGQLRRIRRKRVPATHVVAALICVVGLAGCATRRLFDHSDQEAEAAAHLQELQLKVMRFADEYVGGVAEPARRLQLDVDGAFERLTVQEWKLSQATAAYSIASGPNPITNSLDCVVLATLSRMVMEDEWVQQDYGVRVVPLADAHRRLEQRAWSLAAEALSEEQLGQLRELIDRWRAENPRIRAVSYVHFRDFAAAIAKPEGDGAQLPSSLFSLLGIDPLSRLDPAVREIAQTRQLAERTIYYAQRVPTLLDMEAERLTYVLAVMPETRTIVEATQRAGQAAQQAGRTVDRFPELLSQEREAAIHQFMAELRGQQREMLQLSTQIRGALDAGTVTADSIAEAIQQLKMLVEQFQRRRANAPSRPTGRAFDITEYSAAVRELGASARQLGDLMQEFDAAIPRVQVLAEDAEGHVRSLILYSMWCAVSAVLLGAAAIAVVMFGYRLALYRMRSGGRTWSRVAEIDRSPE